MADTTANDSSMFAGGTFNNGDTGGDSSFVVRKMSAFKPRARRPPPALKKKYTTIKGKCWGVFENLMWYEKSLDTYEYCVDIKAEEEIQEAVEVVESNEP